MSQLAPRSPMPAAPSVRRLLKAILSHPAALKLRRPLRNAWWSFRGRGTANPAVPHDVRSVLFVCLGNICRSPFGAELSKRVFAEIGRPDIRIASAGIRPSQDNGSPECACRASAPYGVSLAEHRPQLLTRVLVESHDMIIVMEWRHFQHLRTRFPDQVHRIFLLPMCDTQPRNAFERYNITDPFGRQLEAFEECYRRMDRSVRALVAGVAG